MKASKLYSQLDGEFVLPGMDDDWVQGMGSMRNFFCEAYTRKSIGIVLDNAESVTGIYTAVFPTAEVLARVFADEVTDAMLFVHHPRVWDISHTPVYSDISLHNLEEMRRRHISMYNLHVPLDHFGPHGTGKTLAEALGLTIVKPFNPYHGALAGVVCDSPYKTAAELQAVFTKAVGHETRLYAYGGEEIAGGRVAVVAGGGNDVDTVRDMLREGVSTLVTGVSVRNEISEPTHMLEEMHGINLLGGTHYSTEQFACRSMCDWFAALGLPCTFVAGVPQQEDM